MGKLSFKNRLNIGFSIVFIIMLITTLYSIWQLNAISQSMKLVYQHPFKVSNSIREIQIEIYRTAQLVSDLRFTDTYDKSDSLISEIEKSDSLIFDDLQLINKQYLGNKVDVDQIFIDYSAWNTTKDKIFKLKQENKSDSLDVMIEFINHKQVTEIIDHIKIISDFASNKAEAEMDQTIKRKENTLFVLITVLFLVSLFVFFISNLISKRINRPIKKFIDEAKAIFSIQTDNPDLKFRNEEELFNYSIKELRILYQNIEQQNEEIRSSNELLSELNRSLEKKVNERTIELKQAKEKAEHSEEKILLLMNSTAEGIYGIDLNGCCTFANKSCFDLLGYNYESDFMGKNIHDLIHHSYPDKQPMDIAYCKINSAFHHGTGTHVEDEVFWRADGTSFPVEYFSYPQFKNGQIVGAVVTFNDITERKLIEEQILKYTEELKKLNRDKDRFMSILAHDLKNPFNAILGYLGLLAENIREYDIDKIEKQVHIVNNSAQKVFNLLKDLLLWAQSQSGNIPFEPQALNFTEICESVVGNLSLNAKNKKITIHQFAAKNLTVFADKDMLKTILRNLVSNAIKFTKSGGRIDISAEQTSENITISVADNGIGIAPEIVTRLFNITQVHTTEGTANESGTGLGLLLCKEFVEKHGGKIWVESKEGKGSTFYFTLFYNHKPEEKIISNSDVLIKDRDKLKKLKILIVENDESFEKLLPEIVNLYCEEVFYAKNQWDAVEICRNNPHLDLILMDVQIPAMDRYEATRQIRQFNKDVVIISQSTFALSGEKEKASEAGSNDYFSKPLKQSLWVEIIKKHFNK